MMAHINKQKLLIISSHVLSAVILFFAFMHLVSADSAEGIVNCDGVAGSTYNQVCGWQSFVQLINKVLRFIVFDISLPACAILFMYAGWQMMTAQGDPGKFKNARKIFVSVAIGFAIVMAAYYVIKFVLGVLGFEDKTGLF